jgi:hypothetical protein
MLKCSRGNLECQKLFLPILCNSLPLHSNSQYCSYFKIAFGRLVEGITP